MVVAPEVNDEPSWNAVVPGVGLPHVTQFSVAELPPMLTLARVAMRSSAAPAVEFVGRPETVTEVTRAVRWLVAVRKARCVAHVFAEALLVVALVTL